MRIIYEQEHLMDKETKVTLKLNWKKDVPACDNRHFKISFSAQHAIIIIIIIFKTNKQNEGASITINYFCADEWPTSGLKALLSRPLLGQSLFMAPLAGCLCVPQKLKDDGLPAGRGSVSSWGGARSVGAVIGGQTVPEKTTLCQESRKTKINSGGPLPVHLVWAEQSFKVAAQLCSRVRPHLPFA